jgi:hypothetical protein
MSIGKNISGKKRRGCGEKVANSGEKVKNCGEKKKHHSVMLLPCKSQQCKSHGHRVCQQLLLRDNCLAQRLSIHHQIF